jgi:hypothetical protein
MFIARRLHEGLMRGTVRAEQKGNAGHVLATDFGRLCLSPLPAPRTHDGSKSTL